MRRSAEGLPLGEALEAGFRDSQIAGSAPATQVREWFANWAAAGLDLRAGSRFAVCEAGRERMAKIDRIWEECLPAGLLRWPNHAQSPLLLVIRLYWGWQFMQDGWGKLTHLDRVTQFFASLSLPAPGADCSAGRAGGAVGGALSSLGLLRGWSRWFCL